MSIHRSHKNHGRAGFTLIEVIIVIAIMAIVAGAMAPLALKSINSSRTDLTNARLKVAYEAIMGPADSQGLGFLCDVGRLPSSLAELAVNSSSLPTYASSYLGAGMGWRGPYVTDGVASNQPVDAWGTALTFSNYQVRSAGPDHTMNTSDDLVYPSIASSSSIYGTIIITVSVYDSGGGGAYVLNKGTGCTFYYAVNGSQQSTTVTTPAGGPYSCSLPQGIHAVTITGQNPTSGQTITANMTVFCRAGTTVTQTVGLR